MKFLSRGSGYTLFLTPTEAVLSLVKPSPAPSHAGKAAAAKRQKAEGAVLRMGLVGANPHAVVSGAQPLRAKSNYFVGKRHETGVANYREVTYRSASPGIDLDYHGRNGRLEYDFNVAPGADPGKIGLNFKGAERVAIDRRGISS